MVLRCSCQAELAFRVSELSKSSRGLWGELDRTIARWFIGTHDVDRERRLLAEDCRRPVYAGDVTEDARPEPYSARYSNSERIDSGSLSSSLTVGRPCGFRGG